MLNKTKSITLAALLSVGAGAGWSQPTTTAPDASAAADQVITRHTFRNIAKTATPAVANVQIKSKSSLQQGMPGLPENLPQSLRELFENRNWNQDFGRGRSERYSRSGSAVLIRKDGYLVTSEHVIRDINEGDLEISLPDGRSFTDVEVVGTDQLTDLAVLKLNDAGTTDLPYLEWSDSDAAQVGDHVLAVGNPLEFSNSVSDGIISAKHRTINKAGIEDLLQTTAVINPGNSGGALVDLDGKLVGINMAIATSTGMWSGLGFAIPSNTAKTVTDQIINKGKALRGYLGIQMEMLMVGLARQLGYDKDYGVVVVDVTPGTGADKAGIQPYDIIASVDGKKIEHFTDMHRSIGNLPAGTTVTLEIWRDDGSNKAKQISQEVVLSERPDDQALKAGTKGGKSPLLPGVSPNDQLLGMKLEPRKQGEGLEVKAVNPKSPTEQANVKPGDVVLQVNRQPVNTVQEFKAALKHSNTGSHMLYLERNGTVMLQMVPGE